MKELNLFSVSPTIPQNAWKWSPQFWLFKRESPRDLRPKGRKNWALSYSYCPLRTFLISILSLFHYRLLIISRINDISALFVAWSVQNFKIELDYLYFKFLPIFLGRCHGSLRNPCFPCWVFVFQSGLGQFNFASSTRKFLTGKSRHPIIIVIKDGLV